MRILVFVFHFPPLSGGGSVVSFDITTALANLGHEVTVLVPDVAWKGSRYEPIIDPKVTVVRIKTPSRSSLKLAARRCHTNLRKEGERLGKKIKFDFIFTIFHPFHMVPRAAASCAKTLGIPLIIKVDDAVYEKSSGLKSFQRRIEKIYNSKSLTAATKILVSNVETANLVSSFYKIPQEKIVVVPNGIDISFFEKKAVKKEKIIVFSGIMYYHRGLDMLIDAATKIVAKIPETKFVLLGEGPEMERLQLEVKEKNLSSNVDFKGWVDRKEIPSYLSNASVGIGPLRLTQVTAQALPLKVLEYMASSLPIIAKKGTLPEDVLKNGENGYFVEDSEELAEKILELLSDPFLVEKMACASQKMVQRFSMKNVVNSILDIYKTG